MSRILGLDMRPAGRREHLLLAAREGAALLGRALPEPGKEREGVLDAALDLGLVLDDVGAHLEVFEHGEAGEDASALGHEAQAFLVHVVGGHPGDVLAHQPHAAFLGVEEAGDRAQRRGLARAVAADEGDDLALLDGEGDSLEGVDLAVVRVDVLELEEAHGLCSRRVLSAARAVAGSAAAPRPR